MSQFIERLSGLGPDQLMPPLTRLLLRLTATVIAMGAVMATATVGLAAGTPASAASRGSGPSMSVAFDGRQIGDGPAAGGPVTFDPARETALAVTVTNRGTAPLAVRAVQVRAGILGLALVSYTAQVGRSVEPGETATIAFPMDLADVGAQATGLLNGDIALVGAGREPLARQAFPVLVRGEWTSVYGLFGAGIAVVTALLLVLALVQLRNGTLPDHRWSRALRFGVPAVGAGLTVTLSLSALSLMAPGVTTGGLFLLACLLAGVVVGYLTPAPEPAGPSGLGEPAAAGGPDALEPDGPPVPLDPAPISGSPW